MERRSTRFLGTRRGGGKLAGDDVGAGAGRDLQVELWGTKD